MKNTGWLNTSVLVSGLFYLLFFLLYGLSLTRIWIHRKFIADPFVTDAGVMMYKIIYRPVFGLGGLLLLEMLFLFFTGWMKKIICLSHVLLGVGSLAYCVFLWNHVNQSFHPFFPSTLKLQGAWLGPGYYLFVGASVTLTVSGLCSLRAITGRQDPTSDPS